MSISNKVYFHFFIFSIVALLSFNNVVLSQIGIGFGYPDDLSVLSYEQFQRLESKITTIASKEGNGGSGMSEHGLVCIPRISVSRDEQVDGGLSKTNVIALECTFSVTHMLDGSVLASIEKKIAGTGSNREKAIDNAINKVSSSDTVLLKLFSSAREKFKNMYVTKCESIIKKAEVKKSGRQYDEALALLMSVPSEAEQCYEKAMKATQSIYVALSDQECKQHLLNARTYISHQNYSDGLNELSFIDPLSSCYKEAMNMSKEVESKITAEQNREWQAKQEARRDNVELQKMRIEAVKDIVVSYYKSKQANYNIIVK
ncbi:MAG: hypothetical protein LW818_05700 [Ignavibacteriae bacterium]|jgi:hypothetical protein|nr:hypothetical protein [Ignavibacteriota bacterium]